MAGEANDSASIESTAIDSTAIDEATEPSRKRPGFFARWFRRGVWLVLLLAITIGCLPTLLSRTALGDSAIAMVSQSLPPGCSIGGVNFSWLSPVAVRDVSYAPAKGQQVQVDEAETSQSLLAMLIAQAMPEELTLRGVRYELDLDQLATTKEETNADDAEPSPEKTTPLPRLPRLALSDVQIVVNNGPFREPVTLTFPSLDVGQGESGELLKITGEGSLFSNADATPLSVTAEIRPGEESGRVGLTVSRLESGTLLTRLKSPPFRAAGQLDLQLLLESNGPDGPMTAKLTADSPDMQLAALSDGATVVPIQNLALRCGVSHQPASGEFTLEPASVQSSLVNGAITCRGIAGDNVEARFEGDINLLGPAVELAGLPPEVNLSNVQFAPLVGNYSSDGLTLEGGIRWDEASAFGLSSNVGRADYRLSADTLHVDMVDVPVGDGQLLGSYDIDLQSTPPVLRFPGGPVLQGVTITETMCRDWLKYVSPSFANATDIRGRLGLTLSPVDATLGNGSVPDLTGQLVINGATMQPGPVGRDLISTVGELGSTFGSTRLAEQLGDGRGLKLVELPSQKVDFAVRGNTVYHRGFSMNSGKVTIQTAGAVELSNNVDLVARMTVDTSRLRDRPILAGALSRPIDFPITGTIENPKIDRGALANFGADAAAGAVGGLLQKLLDR